MPWHESCLLQTGNKGKKGTKPWTGALGRQRGGTQPAAGASREALPTERPIHLLAFAPGQAGGGGGVGGRGRVGGGEEPGALLRVICARQLCGALRASFVGASEICGALEGLGDGGRRQAQLPAHPLPQQRPSFQRHPWVKLRYILPGNEGLCFRVQGQDLLWPPTPGPPVTTQAQTGLAREEGGLRHWEGEEGRVEAEGGPEKIEGSQTLVSTAVYPDLCGELLLYPNAGLDSSGRLTQLGSGGLRTTEVYSLAILEAGRPKSRCCQKWYLLEALKESLCPASPLTADSEPTLVSLCSSMPCFNLPLCVHMARFPSSYEDTCPRVRCPLSHYDFIST